MTQDPMISALQGPQDPTMDALFSQPPQTGRRALQPLDLLIHGQERLKDPNIPAYDPGNTFKVTPPGTPTFPPPWGGGGRITQPAQQLQHMAGEVVPFPITPQMSDLRRMQHEDMLKEMQRMGPARIDQYNRNWPPIQPIPGPGANE